MGDISIDDDDLQTVIEQHVAKPDSNLDRKIKKAKRLYKCMICHGFNHEFKVTFRIYWSKVKFCFSAAALLHIRSFLIHSRIFFVVTKYVTQS